MINRDAWRELAGLTREERRLNSERVKNRYHISVKLDGKTYRDLYLYAKTNDLNLNSAAKRLLAQALQPKTKK